MARLGISLYPEHSTLEKDRAYVTPVAKYGFKRIFTCLLSVDKEREEILAEFRELINHAHSYGMEVVLDVAPFVFEKLHVSYGDLPFFAEMHADSVRLGEGFDPLKEALMTYDPQNLKIEINASLGTKYLDSIVNHYPKLENIVARHSFYPQHYSGINYERFEKCSQNVKDLDIKVAAFVSSQEEGICGPWPMNEGLYTLEVHRDLPIDVQAKHLSAARLVDDAIIANAYASERGLSTLSKIDPGKLTFRIDSEADLHLTEEKILYEHPRFVRGNMSECTARSTMPRITYAEGNVPPEDIKDLEHGDVVIVNSEYSRHGGELHIVLEDVLNDGRKSVISHIPEDGNILLDYTKPWKPFGFMRQYQERGETMAVPIYRKIKDLVIQGIEDRAANSPIDSERDMAVHFDASRMTVRKVIGELVDEGSLYRDKNEGTFVTDHKLLKKNTAAEMLQEEINEFVIMYFNVKDATDVASILGIDQDNQVLSVVRLNTVSSKPTNVEEIFFIRNQISDADMENLENLLGTNDYAKNGHIT